MFSIDLLDIEQENIFSLIWGRGSGFGLGFVCLGIFFLCFGLNFVSF